MLGGEPGEEAFQRFFPARTVVSEPPLCHTDSAFIHLLAGYNDKFFSLLFYAVFVYPFNFVLLQNQ